MGWIRRTYDWTLAWAESAYSAVALFFLAVIEASFFIIPPDVLLIALCAGKPKKSWFFAAICTVGSVVGALLGYLIGYAFFDTFGTWILDTLHLHDAFGKVGAKYEENAAIALFAAAFTPIPFKVFTIAAGTFKISLVVFTAACIVGRGMRFFLVASLIYFFGPAVKTQIDRHFNLFTILFTLLGIGGFVAVKFLK